MWTIYQDSPAYGCDDNPSYRWHGFRSENGHIVQNIGPFDTRKEAFEASGANRLDRLNCTAKGDPGRADTQAAKRLLAKRAA